MATPITAEEGLWHRLSGLKDRIGKEDEGQAALLWERVLRLSNPGDRFNHSEALQLFCANFWRRPWVPPSESHDAWLRATVDLLEANPFGSKTTPLRWAGQFEHRVTRSADRLKVTYAGNPSDDDILHWRLFYPLGTVINARTLHLDRGDRSRLDSKFVLA